MQTDSLVLFFLYYVVVGGVFFLYLACAKRVCIPLYSFSNAFYFGALILSILPGYYVASGKIDSVIFGFAYRGFDYELYRIYLLTSVMVPCALLLAALAGKRWYLAVELKEGFKVRYALVFTFVVFYLALYFYWVPEIPVFNLITDGMSSAYNARLRVTHGFALLEPPFLFRYWRNIVHNYVAIMFFIYLFLRIKEGGGRVNLVLFFLLVCFCYAFTIEKAPLFQFLICCVIFFRILRLDFDLGWRDSTVLFGVRGLVLMSSVALALSMIYYFFMGGGIGEAVSRIARQDASNYLQIQYVRESGYTGLSGLQSNWLGYLGVEKAENVSKRAILDMYQRDGSEGVGAAGGMFATNIFFMVGWWFAPIAFLYVFVLGFIDKVFVNTIRNSASYVYGVLLGFYIIFMVDFSLAARADLKYIFSFNYFFSPEIIIMMLLMLVFFRLRLR